MKTKTIELPVIPEWLESYIENILYRWKDEINSNDFPRFNVLINDIICVLQENIIEYDKNPIEANSNCMTSCKKEIKERFKWCGNHFDDIFIAMKYGYEVEDDD